MDQLINCVANHHSLPLVALAAIICALGVHATFALGDHALNAERRRSRWLWGAAAVVATGSSIWATHFISMLAFRPGAPSGFAPIPTIASYVLAVALVGLGGLVVARYRSRTGRLSAGAIVGIAISAMHYTGMSGYRVAGALHWDRHTVALSVAAGLLLSMAAVELAADRRRWARALAPILLLLAVCADHFLGMTALTVAYDPLMAIPAGSADAPLISLLVGNVGLVIVGLALAALQLSRQSARRRNAEQNRLRNLADIAVEGLIICNGETIVAVNTSFERMIGRRREDLVDQPLSALFPGLRASDVPQETEINAELSLSTSGGIPVQLISQPMFYETDLHTVIAVRDQRERLRREAEMRRLANNDPLTGLANRLRFKTCISERCASRREEERTFALLALDLDGFKAVNDTYGHAMGDAVLVRVANRLRAVVRDHDLVARLGGDEFAILQGGGSSPESVQDLADRVLDVLSRPLIIDGQVIEIATSIGLALSPADGATPEALAGNADLALYRAKEDGKGVFRMFESEMNARMQSRRSLEQGLRRAVARQEFQVHYQPQVDVATGAYKGAEALLRWFDPELGMISPGDFIPLAEETGLISNIGEWALRTACADAMTWPAHLTVAVNLSPIQFRDPRLVSIIAGVLAETGLPPSRLDLEITESVLLNDNGAILAMLNQLRTMGISISMDDFGTGYSSLSYLRKFPFDKIKIDKSFIGQIANDKDSAAIVRAMVLLGQNLGMTTTAEGVETADQYRVLMAEGCDHIQGFLVGKPVSSQDIHSVFAHEYAIDAAA